jgi:molybdate transport system substrate-binding protein
VPCGRLAIELASFLKTEIEVSTWEPNVRSVRTKVELGEVDAGLIYITDGTNRVEITSVKGSERVKTKYPIVVVDDAKPSAMDFVDYVLSHEGQETLTQFRFGTP